MMALRNVYKERRDKGSELLDYWAASMRSRLEGGKFGGMFAESVPSDIAKQLKALEKGGGKWKRSKPGDIGDDAWKMCLVESCFMSMGARAAVEVYGTYSSQSTDENRKNWDKFSHESRRRIRALCFHVLVSGHNPGDFPAKDTFAYMALFGKTKNSFGRWLSDCIDGVREYLGS